MNVGRKHTVWGEGRGNEGAGRAAARRAWWAWGAGAAPRALSHWTLAPPEPERWGASTFRGVCTGSVRPGRWSQHAVWVGGDRLSGAPWWPPSRAGAGGGPT